MEGRHNRFFATLARVYKAILSGVRTLSGVAAWIAAILVIVEVLARYLFNYAILFGVEYAIYTTAFLCFVGAVYTQVEKGHVNVDLVTSKLPKGLRQWLEVLTLAASLVVAGLFFYWSMVIAKVSAELGSRAISSLATPLVYPQSIMPLGFLLLSLVILVQLFGAIRSLFKPSGKMG